jgi:hypothetical protein
MAKEPTTQKMNMMGKRILLGTSATRLKKDMNDAAVATMKMFARVKVM